MESKNDGRLRNEITQLTKGGGWLRFPWPGVGTVFIRCAEVDGRVRAVELYIDGGGEPIQAGALRRLPLGLAEHEGAITREMFPSLMIPSSGQQALDLSGPAAAFFATIDSVSARIRGGAPKPEADFTLSAPQDGLTDAFLSDVGKAYHVAVKRRLPPATELARQAGVSVRTAQSWIYKARKRGLMPPASHRGRIA